VKPSIFDPDRCTQPKNILLTRLSAIGDCLLTIPLAVKAKQLWPEAKLTWVVDCPAAPLLEPHPAIDEVLRIEKRWLKHPSRWSELRQELRSKNFDLVLDPQGLSKSSLLGRLSGAGLRVGFDYSQSREVAPLLATRRVRRTARHMVDTYLQLLSPWCNITPGEGEFAMPIYADSAQRAEFILRESHFTNATGGRRWVAINAGAGWPSKQWPPERFGRLAHEIQHRYGLPSLVFWAGDNEHALAEEIVEHSGGAAVAAPPTNLCELLELIRQADLLISSDTAALQIASAVKTPCVGLFGPTWADEVGPYGNKHISIQSSVLPDRKKSMRRSSNSSMNAIEISEVIRACGQLLAAVPAMAFAA
jgi:heptosyltransferase-1